MLVAITTEFRASRKDPLAEVVARTHAAFVSAFGREPLIEFGFGDAPHIEGLTGNISSVDRVLKRFPQFKPFEHTNSPIPAIPAVRQISNRAMSPAAGQQVDIASLLEIFKGVPRSYPFHSIAVHLHDPAFGQPISEFTLLPLTQPGITISDSWWVSGRSRAMMALAMVEVERASKKLPPLPAGIEQVMQACGKAGKPKQFPLPSSLTPQQTPPDGAMVQRIQEIVRSFRSRLAAVIAEAELPHDLPSATESLKTTPIGTQSGPKKPALEATFKPLGYSIKGESGMFTLRRRGSAGHTIEISLDVGTWSNSLTGFYAVLGPGFSARLPLPPVQQADGMAQYSIGDADRWRRLGLGGAPRPDVLARD